MSKNTIKDITNMPSSIWLFYLTYIVPGYKLLLFIATICIAVSVASGIIVPLLNQELFTVLKTPLGTGESFIQHVLPVLSLVFICQLLFKLANTGETKAKQHYEPQMKNRVSEIMTSYVHHQSIAFLSNKMMGSIHSQVEYIVNGLEVFNNGAYVIANLLVVLINCGLLWQLNVDIVIVFVLAISLLVTFITIFGKRINKAVEKVAEVDSSFAGKMIDSLTNFAVVKYFARAKQEQQLLAEEEKKVISAQKKRFVAQNYFDSLSHLTWMFGLIATYFVCAVMYQNGQIDLPRIMFVSGAYYCVMDSVRALKECLPGTIETFAKARRVYGDLVKPIEIVDKPNAVNLKVNKGKIEFKNLSFGYRSKLVLKDLSLSIHPGERVGIVGVSGSGKTTLMNLLMRFYDPKRGQILIDGQDIKNVKQDSLREKIAFIPQDATMFNRTIAENIGYGKEGSSITEIKKAAENASAEEFIMATEKQYNSFVGDKGVKLSGGQRQRIAIARAFLKNAPILILDEATSALDSETEVAIQESFEKLSKGRTTIAIAHRLSTLRHMDRIVVLDKGVIVEQGTHQQLLRQKGKYYQLWQMQSDGFLNIE